MDRLSAAFSSGGYGDKDQEDQYGGERKSATEGRHGSGGYGDKDQEDQYGGERKSTTEGRHGSGGYGDKDQEDQYGGERKSATEGLHGKPGRTAPTTSELMSSAKIVAEAAKSSMNKEGDENIDRARVSEAASNILSGAAHYGKLDEKEGLGSYVGKAEDMLRKYGSGGGGSHNSSESYKSSVGKERRDDDENYPVSGEHETRKKEDEEEEGGSGGVGGYLKVAQGFLKK
ncbi:hornerin [Pyrus ussuriensis x Pyrus communis]|uniref:Hornerin n=1 Tax=Pyrus ussuriensis x Pyrus communis TaxID=2448454 RepID=A0A5N5HE66_9ROSA|nr:hornerin [Pyrus ussuriensis x Pyrus communis]